MDATARLIPAASIARPGSDVQYKNGGSVTLSLSRPKLGPRNSWSPDPELVLVVDDPALATLNATWTATIKGHHKQYCGSLSIPVERCGDGP